MRYLFSYQKGELSEREQRLGKPQNITCEICGQHRVHAGSVQFLSWDASIEYEAEALCKVCLDQIKNYIPVPKELEVHG